MKVKTARHALLKTSIRRLPLVSERILEAGPPGEEAYAFALRRARGRRFDILFFFARGRSELVNDRVIAAALRTQNELLQVEALEEIAERGSFSVPELVADLISSPHGIVRASAAEACGRLHSEATVFAVKKALLDSCPSVRTYAAISAAEQGQFEYLRERQAVETDLSVRIAIAIMLFIAKAISEDDVEKLLTMIDDDFTRAGVVNIIRPEVPNVALKAYDVSLAWGALRDRVGRSG